MAQDRYRTCRTQGTQTHREHKRCGGNGWLQNIRASETWDHTRHIKPQRQSDRGTGNMGTQGDTGLLVTSETQKTGNHGQRHTIPIGLQGEGGVTIGLRGGLLIVIGSTGVGCLLVFPAYLTFKIQVGGNQPSLLSDSPDPPPPTVLSDRGWPPPPPGGGV